MPLRGGTRRPSPKKRGFSGSPPHAGSPPASKLGRRQRLYFTLSFADPSTCFFASASQSLAAASGESANVTLDAPPLVPGSSYGVVGHSIVVLQAAAQ